MSVALARIDDRMIHGQVTVGWGRQLQPDTILLANNVIASDPWHTLDIRVQLAEIPLFAGDVMATFAVWGKNITDEEYKSNGIDLGALGWAFNNYGERATAGAYIKLEWGA